MKNKIIRLLLLCIPIAIGTHLSICTFAQNVGIGTTTPAGKLHIKGAADTTQLIIDANSTQSNTNPLIKLRNNSGADLMWIHSDNINNTFIGFNAGRVNNSSGVYNTFIGSNAGYSNTTGYSNTANGSQALYLNTTGNFNTASGNLALSFNTTGQNNTANGYQALYQNTTGQDNTANGVGALFANRTAGQNTAIGNYALFTQSYNPGTVWLTGNTAVGYAALTDNNPTSISNGQSNTAVGQVAMRYNTTGYDNAAFGAAALYTNSTGYSNTATGRQSLFYNSTGSTNTAIGYKSLRSNTIGNYNTAMGTSALYANTDGYDNTAMGNSALYTNITGTQNVAIGVGSDVDLTNSYNNTILGAFAHVSGNNDVAIGCRSYTNVNNLALLGSATTAQVGGYANWSNFSDGRFKTGVEENVKGLDFILRLRPVTYHINVRGIYNLWGISPYGKEDENISMTTSMKNENKQQMDEAITNKESIRMTGFIAQEVEKAAVKSGYDFDGVIKPAHDKDHYRLAYGEFVVPLVKAVQELNERSDKQQAMIADKQKEIDEMKQSNADLRLRLDKIEKLLTK